MAIAAEKFCQDKEPQGRGGLAEFLLSWPLSAVLAALCLWELATWAPNYLTWPLWADHDVFATAATAWQSGVLPYREFFGNNFPGTIYLFWLFGKLFGFGWALGPSMYGFDAALVAAFGATLVAWSWVRFGRALPGLVGYGGFLGYYLSLDYSQAAQRDWQGPIFVGLGILLVQITRGNRFGRTLSAILAAIGLVIRPQAILLLPAQAFAVASEARQRERSATLAVGEWGAILALGLAAGFSPLFLGGLWGDFRTSLKVVAYGGKYNLVTPQAFVLEFFLQFQPLRTLFVPLGVICLASRSMAGTRRTAAPWIIAFLGVLLYRPMSPHSHSYLSHPLMMVWTALAAILVRMTLDQPDLSAPSRLVIVMLVMGLGLTVKPRFCNPNGSLDAPRLLKEHREPGPKPTGYARHPDVPAAAHYEWSDYRDLLDYIRQKTPSTIKIANCLKYVPAITGPTGRLSALPAESVAWLIVVREDDVQLFVERLKAVEDCIVVWSPSEKTLTAAPQMAAIYEAIEAEFEFSKQFGAIEVWTRKSGGTAR